MESKIKFVFVGAFLIVLLIGFTGVVSAVNTGRTFVQLGNGEINWGGRGATNGVLDTTYCDPDYTPDHQPNTPYLHWIFTTDGGKAEASSASPRLILGGSGSGNFIFEREVNGAFHFMTPYYAPDPSKLTAKVKFWVVDAGQGAWNLIISHGCPGSPAKDLTVSVTADPSYRRTFGWDITNDVDQASIETANGAGFKYTIAVDKKTREDSDWIVSGVITVSNPNNFAVGNVLLANAVPGGDCILSNTVINVPAGGTFGVSYSCRFANNPGKNTDTSTISWPDFGSPHTSASGAVQFIFGSPSDLLWDEIDVVDSHGNSWHFADSDVVSSLQTFHDTAGTCTSHDNVATIIQTNTKAHASVKVCVGADLVVTKTAQTQFTRSYIWDISATLDGGNVIRQQAGSKAHVNYIVKASETGYADSGWLVRGMVTVTNPNDWGKPIPFTVVDALADAKCTFVGEAGGELAAGASITLPYTCSFESQPAYFVDLPNMVQVSWDRAAYHTPNGSSAGTTKFQFGAPTHLVNQSVLVFDRYNGVTTPLGSAVAVDTEPYTIATYDKSPRTFEVPQFGCVNYGSVFMIPDADIFTERVAIVCGPVQTAAKSMNYWQQDDGQTVIQNGGFFLFVCNSGMWLRKFAPFQDLSAFATCGDVANYVTNVVNSANVPGASTSAILKAQMLTTALNIYFSDSGLGGNVIGASVGDITVDLEKICSDPNCASYEDAHKVFGGASSMTVKEMLTTVSGYFSGGAFYENNIIMQEFAKDAFDAVNTQNVFEP